jgi:hypothetical protein
MINNQAGAGVFVVDEQMPSRKKSRRLGPNSTVFLAETFAVGKAAEILLKAVSGVTTAPATPAGGGGILADRIKFMREILTSSPKRPCLRLTLRQPTYKNIGGTKKLQGQQKKVERKKGRKKGVRKFW